MPPSRWDDEEDDESSGSDSPTPQTTAAAPRRKFDDEEDEEDVLDSWDAADDSETERTKAKAAEEAKVRADAIAAANKKSKSQRIEEHRMQSMRRRQEEEDLEDEDDSDEDQATRLARMREMEKAADLKNASDLFGDIGVNPARATAVKPVVLSISGADAPGAPGATVDMASLSIFNPDTRDEFIALRDTLTPLIASSNNVKKARYPVFAQEFTKLLCKDLSSEQIKKVASGLTALANEKMKEEKAAEKGGKKSKAAKTKTTLNASRGVGDKGADLAAYDEDGLDDGDFM